ncbi:MAG: PAS domain S-box protein [Spirochaetia bacterium]|nr:PAS domain S-box protein [Spirochaetia bacterium]
MFSEDAETLFWDFFDGNSAIKLLISPSDGAVMEANRSACLFYGYAPETFRGMSFFAINMMSEAEVRKHFELVISEAQRDFNVYHRCYDGDIVNVSVNFGLITFHGMELILAIVFDVTGERRALTASHLSQTQFLTVLNSMDAVIYVADLNSYEILFANRYMKDSFGEETEGRRCWEVIHGSGSPCKFCGNERLLEGVRRLEYRSMRNRLWYQFIDRAIVWIDGRLVRISIGIDITERKQLEQEIIGISEKERIRIGNDLHDGIGQYFTGIGFLTQVIKDKLAACGLPEKSIAEEIIGLIEEAKNHTRILAKGLSPVNMDKNGIFAAIGELRMDTERIFGSECSFLYDKNITVEDNFTATHIYYIVREAVNNAMRHGGAKHVDIIIKEWDEGIRIDVQDDGCGFNPDTVARGLGLNLMKYRADVIGGTLGISGGKNGGALISCIIPRFDGHAE